MAHLRHDYLESLAKLRHCHRPQVEIEIGGSDAIKEDPQTFPHQLARLQSLWNIRAVLPACHCGPEPLELDPAHHRLVGLFVPLDGSLNVNSRAPVAIALHIRGLRADGLPVPRPSQRTVTPRRRPREIDFYATVEVAA